MVKILGLYFEIWGEVHRKGLEIVVNGCPESLLSSLPMRFTETQSRC